MLNLQKTAELVRQELENDIYTLEILKEGLINYSALARKLMPKIQQKNKDATIESVSMAVKRYVLAEKKKKAPRLIQKIISRSQLLTKNDVCHMTFARNESMLNKLMEISKDIDWDKEEIFFMNQGIGEVTIILDEKNKSLLDSCRKYLIEKTDNLAIVSIKEVFDKGDEKSIDVPGVYSYFIEKLARKGINIVEIISTYSQLAMVFKNKDLMRAYEIIDNSIRFFRK